MAQTATARPAAPSLTADVNALAWGQFHLRGGWPRFWGFASFYAIAVGSLMGLAIVAGNASAGAFKYALIGVQAGVLVLFIGARVGNAIRQDLTSRMIESHRLMPLSPSQAVLGYLLGPAAHPLALVAANMVLGLFLSAVGGTPAALWLTANAVLLEFAAFTTIALAFGAFAGKGSSAAVWVGFFVSMYSFAAVGFILPAVNVLASPLAGHTVFNLGVTGGEAAAFYAPAAAFHVWIGGVFFLGACRRYRRDDRLALGWDLGLALLAGWIATSAYAIRRWEDYRPGMMREELARADVQFLGSLAAAMLLAIIPLKGAAFVAADFEARRKLADPSLRRRPLPPMVIALAAAALGLLLAMVPLTELPSRADAPSASWRAAGDAVARTALVLVAFFTSTLYLLRLLYRLGRDPRFSWIIAWVALTWLLPLGADTLRWYMTDTHADVLQTISTLSPIGALIKVWTGRPADTTVGLIFQLLLAGTLMAVFHAYGRRAAAQPQPRSGART
jgi:hypothetical protein